MTIASMFIKVIYYYYFFHFSVNEHRRKSERIVNINYLMHSILEYLNHVFNYTYTLIVDAEKRQMSKD